MFQGSSLFRVIRRRTGTAVLAGIAIAGTVVVVASLRGQSPPLGQITVVHTFTGGEDGANPAGGLIQMPNGKFAGMTYGSGVHIGKPATVFTMTPQGQVTTIYRFAANGREGTEPKGIIQASDGNFYGTATHGGADNLGTIFRVTPAGVYTKLHDFTSESGLFVPTTALVEATDGYLYGVLESGGAAGHGAIYRIHLRTGRTSLFYSFFMNNAGPTQPPPAPLSLGPDGRLYGNTRSYLSSEGESLPGCAYAIGTNGKLTVLTVYDAVINGPLAPPVFLGDGYAYYAGYTGGTATACPVGCGSIFRVAMDGSGTELLYSFTGGADSQSPIGLIAAGSGLFYGINDNISAIAPTIFQVNTATKTGITFAFPPGAGSYPVRPLIQSAGGVLRGSMEKGGLNKGGTTFVLNVGAPSPVPTISGFFPTSGPPGTVVTLWGSNFIGVTGVTLNGLTAQGGAKSAKFVRFVVPPSHRVVRSVLPL